MVRAVVPHGAGLQLKARPGLNRKSSIVNRKWDNPKSKIENRAYRLYTAPATGVVSTTSEQDDVNHSHGAES
jgi:hypothetical protein